MHNFRHALDLAIAAGAVDEATDLGARTIAHFLNQFGRWRELDAMLKQVEKLQIKSEKGITHAEYLWLSQQGEVLRQQGRAAEAERLFRDLLARLEQGAAYDAAYDHALVLQYVGHCVAAQGRPAQAIEWDKRALQEFELLSAMNENAKHMMGACYCDWANNLTSIGQFDEAQKCYE